jgi:hypothetical protein
LMSAGRAAKRAETLSAPDSNQVIAEVGPGTQRTARSQNSEKIHAPILVRVDPRVVVFLPHTPGTVVRDGDMLNCSCADWREFRDCVFATPEEFQIPLLDSDIC